MFDTFTPETNLLNTLPSDLEKGIYNTLTIEPFFTNVQSEFSRNSGYALNYLLEQFPNIQIGKAITNYLNFNEPEFADPFSYNWTESDADRVDVLTGSSPNSQNANTNISLAATNDNLNSNSPQDFAPTISIVPGTLRADRFSINPETNLTVVSGNGNVDFGTGAKDTLDLSQIFSNTVKFNFTYADRGGVIFNPGNGDRIYDAITLNNNNLILFEGIDAIQFADGLLNLSITTNDPLFNQQWNLHMMGVQNAWRFTTGSNQVLVGVQDSGLGFNYFGNIHPDLKNASGYSNNISDDFSDSYTSHGTAVQSIISATSNNGIGMSGINWNSEVINIDVLDQDLNDQSLVEATKNMINTANSKGQRLVINMSLGYSDTFGQNSDLELEQVVANNPNVLFVIAAGNDGNLGIPGISSPAVLAQQYNNVIAVGASWGTKDYFGYPKNPGQRIEYPAWFGWGSQYGDGLTLMGPSEVVSTKATSFLGVRFGYQTDFNGTSAATPNVTGVASLVWSVNPNLTAASVKQILSETAYDLGNPGYDIYNGYGFVNADAAVRRAMVTKPRG
ncbi:S8 family peptidase [Floridanema evergladense]|uniref:S8 family serine peptidase n=1 Tax=Floridaenema evergladense BLCC-F167 TaxID=3153639 RepID=A0ABV4WW64_9CYAN